MEGEYSRGCTTKTDISGNDACKKKILLTLIIITFASVPAPFLSPVVTDILYVQSFGRDPISLADRVLLADIGRLLPLPG